LSVCLISRPSFLMVVKIRHRAQRSPHATGKCMWTSIITLRSDLQSNTKHLISKERLMNIVILILLAVTLFYVTRPHHIQVRISSKQEKTSGKLTPFYCLKSYVYSKLNLNHNCHQKRAYGFFAIVPRHNYVSQKQHKFCIFVSLLLNFYFLQFRFYF
jgi:hypothetical protein